jgi:hypothetical protein
MMSRIPVQPLHDRTPSASEGRPRSVIARALSSGLSVALAGAIVTTAVPAAATPLPLLRLAPEEAPASVLGLDGDGKEGNKDANNLTNALRKAFANRGLSGGEEISLEEMRLTMGCSNDEVGCLAEGGKTLGVRRLVFGYLKPSGGGSYQLDIQILDVDSGKVEAQASVSVSKAELASGEIDGKATAIVNELMPAENTDSDLPPRTDPLVPETGPEVEEPVDEVPAPKEGGIYFGLEKPTPAWKWGGFGVSLGLTVLAGGTAIGMGVWLTAKNGGFRGDLVDTATASLTDANSLNDVDPNLPEGINLCEYAREHTDPTMPDRVRNSSVVAVCNKGDAIKQAQLITGIGTAVFGMATLVFTGLLLIHKRKPAANAMLRHKVRMGVGPTGGGGLSIAGGLRF